jgi:hypothetical protein
MNRFVYEWFSLPQEIYIACTIAAGYLPAAFLLVRKGHKGFTLNGKMTSPYAAAAASFVK